MIRRVSILFLALVASASATVIQIRPDGSGDLPTIQAAMNAADIGDTLQLASGVYTGPGNCDLDPGGKILVVRSESGDPGACVLDCQGRPGQNRRGFRFHSGEGPAFAVIGLTVTGGYVAPNGGAVSCTGSASPTFTDCHFAANGASQVGGAIYCSNGASPAFLDCVFSANAASVYGGAVRAYSASPTFTRCLFEFNQGGTGGALSYYRNCTPIVADCTFRQNDGPRGGGIFFYDSIATVTGCTFVENSCAAEGGGIDNVETVLTLTGCEFFGNQAGEFGGAVSSGGIGGVDAENCLFVGNSSQRGGAVHGQYTELSLTSCTLVANRGILQGSGLTIYGSPTTLERLIITRGEESAAVHCQDPEATLQVTCCDIVDNVGGDWTGCLSGLLGDHGNISADPGFCGAEDGDYSLDAGSPCAVATCGLMGSEPVGCNDPTSIPIQHLGGGTTHPPYPSPTTGGSTLAWELARAGVVTAEIFSLDGSRLWRTRTDAALGPGALYWDGRGSNGRHLAAGLYLARITVSGQVIGRHTVVLTR